MDMGVCMGTGTGGTGVMGGGKTGQRNMRYYNIAEFLKVASARAALGATSHVVEPHLRGQR